MNETEKFSILKQAASITFGQYGVWLFDTWKSHNEQYFDNQLQVIPLTFGLLPHGKALGNFTHKNEAGYSLITLHKSLLDPQGDAWQILPLLGQRFASDVLLHEMIHQAVYQQYGHDGSSLEKFFGSSSHNNPAWCDEVNRLAPMLGLSFKAQVVKRQRVENPDTGKKTKLAWQVSDGYLERAELATFPHCVTAETYYMNESDDR